MIQLGLYEIFEIIIGLFFIWVGIYIVSRNPFNSMSWIIFGFLFGFGVIVGTEPILLSSQTLAEYTKWQKLTDWPLFLSPIFGYNTSLIAKGRKNKSEIIILIAGYLIATIFTIIDIRGGLILKENVIRYSDYRRFDGFAPGTLLVPSILFVCFYLSLAIKNFLSELKKNFWKYFTPAAGGIILLLTAIFTIMGFYFFIRTANFFFTLGSILGVGLFIYSIIRYHLFSPSEKIMFDRSFFYRTIGMAIIAILYLSIIPIAGITLTWPMVIMIDLLLIMILLTHSFYEWFSTFINDLLFNISSGLSVVNDNEIYQAIKSYNEPEILENSTLLRLSSITKKLKKGEAKTPVDALRKTVKEAIYYFKPDENTDKRNKKNLKYELLRMLTFDEAEEGQILWELGFEEYPVRIMTKKRQSRPPLFSIKSASDYSYTSRNAYLALKKEAVHDVTWRISYLEKLSKKKII